MLHRHFRRTEPGDQPRPETAVQRLLRIAESAPADAYTPPAGFPADTHEFLAYLEAGVLTDEQLRYLHSNAFDIYVAALMSAQGNPELADAVALGYRIVAAWLEIRQTTANPNPPAPFGTFTPPAAPPRNPFGA